MKIPLLIIGSLIVLLAVIIYFFVIQGTRTVSDTIHASIFTSNEPIQTMNQPSASQQGKQLQITDEKTGTGNPVQTGDTVNVHYRGTLENGTEFDSSYKRNQPFSFTVGEGRVIQGWEQGLIGMRVGGKRRLVIPPELGYGSRDTGSIPSNSTLIFEIELLEINT